MTSEDPLSLLKTLSPLLNSRGGVNGRDEMQRIVEEMKNASQLVSRCVYLNILRVTDLQEVLEKFIAEGGWKILNTWLVEAKSSENMSLILEVLNILQQLPLRINHLKQNNTPKLVKSFAKTSDCSKVKSVATSLMTQWLAIIKDASTPSESTKKKSKSKLDIKPENSKKAIKTPAVSKAPSFTKFRKTGIENSSESIRKQPKTEKVLGVKRTSIDDSLTSSLPDKKAKPEPKPLKKIAISSDFMDALIPTATSKPRPVKRKPLKPKTLPVSTNVNKMSPSQNAPIVSGEAGDFTGSPDAREKTPSPAPSPTELSKPKLNKYGKPMKSVRWLPDDRIESIRYFEKEEGERVNVTTQTFKDALRRERILERQKLGDFHHQGEGHWRKPRTIDLPAPLVEIGSNSVERQIQEEREKSVLQEIFLSLEMVPESPAEPDPEPYELIPPKLIPIEDPNDPGPLNSRSPSPVADNDGEFHESKTEEENPDLLKDKLREIIQTATAKTNVPDASNDGPSPTTPQEMYFPPMMNNGDPNSMYQMPQMIRGPTNYYPNDANMPMNIPNPNMSSGMMVPPGPVFHPNDQYSHGWGPPAMGHHRPHFMEGPRMGGGHRPPPPRFQRGHRGNAPWRPNEYWRGPRPRIPGPWPAEGRPRFRS